MFNGRQTAYLRPFRAAMLIYLQTMIWTAALAFALATLFALLIVITTQADIVPRAIRRLLITGVRPPSDG